MSTRRRLVAAVLLGGWVAWLPHGAAGQEASPASSLREIEAQLLETTTRQATLADLTTAVDHELQALRHDLVDAANGVLEQHRRLLAAEAEIAELSAEEARRSTVLEAEERRLARVLSGLQRLGSASSHLWASGAEASVQGLRGGLALRSIAASLAMDVATLRSARDTVTAMRQTQERRYAEAESRRAALSRRIDELDVLILDREAVLAGTTAEREALAVHQAALAEEAGTLRDLVDRLEAERLDAQRQRLAEEERRRAEAARIAAAAAALAAAAEAAAASADRSADAAAAVAAATAAAEARMASERRVDAERLADLTGAAEAAAAVTAPPSEAGSPTASLAAMPARRGSADLLPSPVATPITLVDRNGDTVVALAYGPGTALPSPTTRPMGALPLLNGVILPSGGDVVGRYGQTDRFGGVSRGISLAVSAGAPIVAPLDGAVRFAGNLRGYGRVLILEHRDGYHSVIAGVGRIDVAADQQVLAGEPIAATPDGGSPVDVYGDAAVRASYNGRNDAPILYFEVRHNGRPIDPIAGLTAAQQRGRG